MFTGLSAFPLTPLRDDAVDEDAHAGLVRRLANAGVDSITALGSTGSYPYLSAAERRRVCRIAVENAGDVPVFAGVGALRTSHVLGHIEDAADAGAAGVLLAPMSYQPLTDEDVFGLYRDVAEHSPLPVIVYDNPATTGFTFTTELYGRIADLRGIASVKIPPVPDPQAAAERVAQIRSRLPDHVTIGISGDASAATGLNAGCDAWYSALGGTLPEPVVRITSAARAGRAAEAKAESDRLAPLWRLFAEHGSVRVIAAVAEHLGLATRSCLPLPLRGLDDDQRARVAETLAELSLIPAVP